MGDLARSIVMRWVLIGAFSLGIFAIASILRFFNPGSTHHDAFAEIDVVQTSLAAPLYDPEMAAIHSRLDAAGLLGRNLHNEARMTFPSPDGSVTLSPSDVALLNAEYEARQGNAMVAAPNFEGSAPDEIADAQSEDLSDAGWGDATGY